MVGEQQGLNRAQIDAIVALVEQQGLSETTVQKLRDQYAGCHFTYCMDDDVHFPKAFIERAHFNVYLVDSRQHCSTLTTDFETASGVVLAEILV
jgi:hypothetical protein